MYKEVRRVGGWIELLSEIRFIVHGIKSSDLVVYLSMYISIYLSFFLAFVRVFKSECVCIFITYL